MNKNRNSLDKSVRKKIMKNVKSGQKLYAIPEAPETTATLTPSELLKKTPLKLRLKRKELLDSELKNMALKKRRDNPKRKPSQRTTPGEVEGRNSNPAHFHQESVRWNQALKKQNKVKRVEFAKKTLKRK